MCSAHAQRRFYKFKENSSKNYTGECQGNLEPHQNIPSGTERNTLLSYKKQGKAGKVMFKFKGIVNRDGEI
jgi:hypothetical protein